MGKRNQVFNLTLTALLIALGILIPIVMQPPFKIHIEPASYTLFSHVPLMIAMMISLPMGIYVALGTTLGFAFALTPIVAARAASHLVFVIIFGYIISKRKDVLKGWKAVLFAIALSVVHAAAETLVVTVFMGIGENYLYNILVLVGIGGFIHSLFDFGVSLLVYKRIEPMISKRS